MSFEDYRDASGELQRHQLEALGIRTNIYLAGERSSQPLLLLHGMSTSGDSFRELMLDLANSFFLVAPDIPGFGYTENTEPFTLDHLVEWVASIIDLLEMNPLGIVGHSFGGVLASAYTLFYPEDIRRMLLFSPALVVSQVLPAFARKLGSSHTAVDAGITLSRLLLERQIRVQFHEPDSIDENVWQRRRGDYSRARASTKAVNTVAAADLTANLERIKQRTLIIWGNDDPILDVSQASQLDRLFPSAEVKILDRCGHIPMIEQREQVSKISREFMQWS